jgi:hypothetical protein
MREQPPLWSKCLGVARVLIGPPALVLVGAIEGVRPSGPLTVALEHPAPAVPLVISRVLVVSVFTTLALWAAAGLLGTRRPVLLHFAVVALGCQLPMAGVALLVGRRILAESIARAIDGKGEALIEHPWAILSGLGQTAIGVVLLTAVAAAWLYAGHKRASGLEGPRLALSLAAGIVAAELACRVWSHWMA